MKLQASNLHSNTQSLPGLTVVRGAMTLGVVQNVTNAPGQQPSSHASAKSSKASRWPQPGLKCLQTALRKGPISLEGKDPSIFDRHPLAHSTASWPIHFQHAKVWQQARRLVLGPRVLVDRSCPNSKLPRASGFTRGPVPGGPCHSAAFGAYNRGASATENSPKTH